MDFEAIKQGAGNRVFSAVVRNAAVRDNDRTRNTVVRVVIEEISADEELKSDPRARHFVGNWIMSQMGYGGGL